MREKEDGYVVSEIFNRYPSIQELLDVTEEELLTIKGIGIRSSEDAYTFLKDMQYLTQEHFVVLGINIKNEVLFRETVFIGSLNASIVHPRETFKHLIRRSCASAIVAHNHPSGNPQPSREDIEVTKRLNEVGKVVGIEILDHVIVGQEQYTSLKEKGYL
ncbi:DNA repair protein RadC [Bacillus spongiae]|uniref:DNA repair protein RadC n=2 Tax=Bacillus spongiae TaxID=2683610 RepID=A0ABU8HH20_9BACI